MENKLIGINNITNILNDFLREFDATAEIGIDFAYRERGKKIIYAVVLPDVEADHSFMKNFRRLAPEIECDTFLISFLHELGHHMTMPELSEEDYWYCSDIVDSLEKEIADPNLSKERELEIHEEYYNLPIEQMATDWAINYILNNVKKVADFWCKVQSAIMEFYRLNNVEGV